MPGPTNSLQAILDRNVPVKEGGFWTPERLRRLQQLQQKESAAMTLDPPIFGRENVPGALDRAQAEVMALVEQGGGYPDPALIEELRRMTSGPEFLDYPPAAEEPRLRFSDLLALLGGIPGVGGP